jgi:hypothetical protein
LNLFIKDSSFKKYVEDNALSKINSQQLLLDYICWQQDEKEKELIQNNLQLETLEKLREPGDPLPVIIGEEQQKMINELLTLDQ